MFYIIIIFEVDLIKWDINLIAKNRISEDSAPILKMIEYYNSNFVKQFKKYKWFRNFLNYF